VKIGDRIVVVAADSEYAGCLGTIAELTKDGRIVVDVDATTITWKATFQPHDIDLANRRHR